MELQKIRELIDVFKASDLAEFEFTEGDYRVRFAKRGNAPIAATPYKAAPTAVTDTYVRSPLFGIVHLTPSPGAAPFVLPGDAVQPGQVVCIVEAMKIFHEIKAPHGGRIEKILVASADEVETGAPLMSLVEAN